MARVSGKSSSAYRAAHGETEAELSAVTIVELTHGIYRAKTDADVSGGSHSPMNFAAMCRFIL